MAATANVVKGAGAESGGQFDWKQCDWCLYEMKDEDFGFVWTIKNFPSFTGMVTLESSVFKSPKSQHSWRLILEPKRFNQYDRYDYIGIYLQLVKYASNYVDLYDFHESMADEGLHPISGVEVRAAFGIVDESGDVKASWQFPTTFTFREGNCWGTPTFYKTASPFHTSPLLIRCRVWLPEKLIVYSGDAATAEKAVTELDSPEMQKPEAPTLPPPVSRNSFKRKWKTFWKWFKGSTRPQEMEGVTHL